MYKTKEKQLEKMREINRRYRARKKAQKEALKDDIATLTNIQTASDMLACLRVVLSEVMRDYNLTPANKAKAVGFLSCYILKSIELSQVQVKIEELLASVNRINGVNS